MGSKLELVVRYEDGRDDERVTIGQREIAAFEAQPFAQRDATILRLRYAAYDGLRRAGRLPRDRKDRQMSWDDWNDEVDEVDVEDDEDEQPDPTQPSRPEES